MRRDPLVLDLDGDGLQLIDLGNPYVFFDDNGDGSANATGWKGPTEAFLARDLDGNGLIETQAELFGSDIIDALSDLARNDANGDGRIDAADPIWDSLRIWRDLNSNGISQPHEVLTMAEAGIVSIDLGARFLGYLDGANLVYSSNGFTFADGTVGTAYSVLFGVDAMLASSGPGGRAAIRAGDPTTLGLPHVPGFGDLPDLLQAMQDDAELRAMVETLMDGIGVLPGDRVFDGFAAVAMRWSGADAVPEAGPFGLDGRKIAFVEAIRGAPDGWNSIDPTVLEAAYGSALESLYLRFLIGAAEARLLQVGSLEESVALNADPLMVMTALRVDPSIGTVSGDLDALMLRLGRALPRDDADAALDMLALLMPAVHGLRDEYFAGAAAGVTFANPDFDAYIDAAFARFIPDPLPQTLARATLYATEVIRGSEGDDILSPPDGFWERVSGRGVQIVEPGAGDDLIEIGAGAGPTPRTLMLVQRAGDGDTLLDIGSFSGRLILLFPETPRADLRIAPDGSDIVIGLVGGGSVRVIGHQDNMLSGLDILGRDGAAMVAETGFVIAEPGNTTLVGQSMPETFVVRTGLGEVTVDQPTDFYPQRMDTLLLPDALRADVRFTREDDDLVLELLNGAPGDQVRVIGQMNITDAGRRLTDLEFANGLRLSHTDFQSEVFRDAATPGDDFIEGTGRDDVLFASDGNDTLQGGVGADTYVIPPGTTGDDIIADDGSRNDDIVRFAGLALADVTLARNGEDLRIETPTGSVTIPGQFGVVNIIGTSRQNVIGEFLFTDVALTAADMVRLTDNPAGLNEIDLADVDGSIARGTGDNSYLFGDGVGDVRITGSNSPVNSAFRTVDTLRLPDHSPEDVAYAQVDGDDLRVTLLATGDTVTVVDHFWSNDGRYQIEFVEFADGARHDRADIRALAPVLGGDGADTLRAGEEGLTLIPGPGEDVLRGFGERTTFVLQPGDGHNRIEATQIPFGGGASYNILQLRDVAVGDLDILRIAGAVSDLRLDFGEDDSVYLDYQLGTGIWTDRRPVGEVQLDDGTILTAAQLADLAVLRGTDAAEEIQLNVLTDPAGGNDTLIGSESQDDRVLFRPGSDQNVFEVSGGDPDRNAVVIRNIAPEDVLFSRSGDDLVITLAGHDDSMTVIDQFRAPSPFFGIGRVEVDRFIFDRDAIANQVLAGPDAGDQLIVGTYANEVIRGGGGNDTLIGGAGADTYVWLRGDGDHLITGTGEKGTLGAGRLNILDLRDIPVSEGVRVFTRADASEDRLFLGLDDGASVITLERTDAPGGAPGTGFPVDVVRFAGGETVTLRALLQGSERLAAEGSDVLAGTGVDEVLRAGGGLAELRGGRGNDTYIWAPGDGDVVISERDTAGDPLFDSGDVLRLEGVALASLDLARPGETDDLLLTHLPSGATLRVLDQFLAPLAGIERLELADRVLDQQAILVELGRTELSAPDGDGVLSGSFLPERFVVTAAVGEVITGGGSDIVVVGPGSGTTRITDFRTAVNGTRIELTHEPFADFAALLGAAEAAEDGLRINLGGGDVLVLSGILPAQLQPRMFGLPNPPVIGPEGGGRVLGGPLDERFVLSGSENLVILGAGNDTVEGTGKADTVQLAGVRSGYDILWQDQTVIVTDIDPSDGDMGTKTLVDVSFLRFSADGSRLYVGPSIMLPEDDALAVLAGETVSGNVLANDFGRMPTVVAVNGSEAAVGSTVVGALGTLVLNADGTVSYTANHAAELPAGVTEPDVFSYLAADNAGQTAPATLVVRVTGANAPAEDVVALSGSVLDRSGSELAATTVTFTPQGGEQATTETDASGRFDFELPVGSAGHLGATRAHTAGDPRITTSSALETLRMAVGLEPSWGPATPMGFIAADFNGDGRVTTADALEILRVAVGLTAGSAPRWVFVDQEADLSGLTRSNTQPDFGIAFDPPRSDFGDLGMVGILIGDVQAYV